MKDLLIYMVGIGIFIFSLAAKNELPAALPMDRSDGIIQADFDFGECFSTIGLSSTQWVIKTKEQFEEMEFLHLQSGECITKSVPKIDFKKYSLLGYLAETDCYGTFERKVEAHPTERKVIYSITVVEGMPCNSKRIDYNWVLVPKIPAGVEVEFNLNFRPLPNP